MISVVSCYYNEEQIKNNVINSLDRQECNYELIAIDNRCNEYSSIAKAYNDIKMSIHGEVVFFLHSDVSFDDVYFLERIYDYCITHKNSLIGFAGKCEDGKTYSNLKYKVTKEYIVENQISEFKRVITLDECAFACSKTLLEKINWFDEKLCDNWHLYLAELCIRCNLEGIDIYVAPWEAYHKDLPGGLSVDENFLRTFKKISNKYKNKVPKIYSSCLDCSTNALKMEVTILGMNFLVKMRRLKKYIAGR